MVVRIIETDVRYKDEGIYKTAEQVEAVCCQDLGPILCKDQVRPWAGFTEAEILEKLDIQLDEYGRDSNGHFLEIRFVGGEGGTCGEEVIRTILDGPDDPVLWDSDSSVDSLAPNTSGAVFVTGGFSTYTWVLTGDGFSFDGAGLKEIETISKNVTVYAESGACGRAAITVSDKCTSDSGGVASTVGSWGSWQNTASCHGVTGEADSVFAGAGTKTIGGAQLHQVPNNVSGYTTWDTPTNCDVCGSDVTADELKKCLSWDDDAGSGSGGISSDGPGCSCDFSSHDFDWFTDNCKGSEWNCADINSPCLSKCDHGDGCDSTYYKRFCTGHQKQVRFWEC